ncbi:unnamed protein product [Callosobruchus maculatus]|uniref:Uncharacterized protein n=1 Tax=Callosobruchus maculatus TaxID=64391 RepID=A0A653DDF3_CALMS|nr:unnamed protein product [Callosobruchus maculatus]
MHSVQGRRKFLLLGVYGYVDIAASRRHRFVFNLFLPVARQKQVYC